ncbi:MAG: Rid family detoxifying hydrolase [Acidimicrobiia bacterium]|nr:Rid family detoxifying hydrolase [Acidimicrobiia bacterium]
MGVEFVHTPSAPEVLGPYVPAVRAGDWIVLAGQLGLDPATGSLVEGGAAAETTQAMANIAAVLADAGASVTDIAKTTIFVTDLSEFPAVNEAYGAALGSHRPVRSTVQVAALPAGAGVEIEAWAHAPESR